MRKSNGISCAALGLGLDASAENSLKNDLATFLLAWLLTALRNHTPDDVDVYWHSHPDRNVSNTVDIPCVIAADIDHDDTLAAIHAALSRRHASEIALVEPLASASNALTLGIRSRVEPGEGAVSKPLIEVRIHYEDDLLLIEPNSQASRLQIWMSYHTVDVFVANVRSISGYPESTAQSLLGVSSVDFDAIWSWNHTLPETKSFCMHEVVAKQAVLTPNHIAIDSWDGQLSYTQIEQYSTHTARYLITQGVRPHEVVPLCFEKSKWTIVAVLAVMKSGATFAMMDPSLPLNRLQNMAAQIDARVIVSSGLQATLADSILPQGTKVILDQEFLDITPSARIELPAVSPFTVMYIIFTSGSTGTPKGVLVSHVAYTSSAFPRAETVGYNPASRVLDFASYAFDVSIDSMILTVANGGTLCIPSDAERMNDINGVLRKMRVNYAGLTPSVARILDLDVIAAMQALGLGGEAASVTDVNTWGKYTRIVIGYGPCECTIGCTINGSAATGRDYLSVGTGNGAAMWIVDPDDHDTLMPIGAVGELLVEGPIVGQGYLNDPDKTDSVFITSPAWLKSGHGIFAGRHSRLYKTGDLGKYDPDGSGGIVFAGRKDTQVKLRGQRVELGEIESQLRSSFGPEVNVIVEVITPAGANARPMLVAFLAQRQASNGTNFDDIEYCETDPALQDSISQADEFVKSVLPRYMVPAAFINVNHIPSLISGKTDRKRLKVFGATLSADQLRQQADQHQSEELSEQEASLRRFWCEILSLKESAVRKEDNFFALGGDSVAAMKLSSVCRSQSVGLAVADIFNNSTLGAMAAACQILAQAESADCAPWSLVSGSMDAIKDAVASTYSIGHDTIEDIYPCTPTQESLFTFSLKSDVPYVAQRVATIPKDITTADWKSAWDAVVAATPILRTVVVQAQGDSLQQVVLKENPAWHHDTSLAAYLERDQAKLVVLGGRLARFAIIKTTESEERYMVWTIHHVLYDGWSEPVILDLVRQALQGSALASHMPMNRFVKYVHAVNERQIQGFWRHKLSGATGGQYPHLPHRDYVAKANTTRERTIAFTAGTGSFTVATLIRGAWSLVVSNFIGSDDVVFGETLTGRDIPLAGADRIIGPMIATVPIRVRVDSLASVRDYLGQIQRDMMEQAPYQHMGMQNIRKVSLDAQIACGTGTGLVFQPEADPSLDYLGFEQKDPVQEALHFNPYALMLACGLRKASCRLVANFDDSLACPAQLERMLAQVEKVCHEMVTKPEQQLNNIDCLPKGQLDNIWATRHVAPLQWGEGMENASTTIALGSGSVYPPAAVYWVQHPNNETALAPVGCVGELMIEGIKTAGESIKNPEWLLAGSASYPGRQGRVYATGDLVMLDENGTVRFVRRKEDMFRIGGYTVDTRQLESHARSILPPATKALVVRNTPVGEGEALLMLVTRPAGDKDDFELLGQPREIKLKTPNGLPGPLIPSCYVSKEFASLLKALNQAISDFTPLHMLPYTYLIVEDLPRASGSNSDTTTSISAEDLARAKLSLENVWSNLKAMADLTPQEDMLRTTWSAVLGIDATKIDIEDNFFRLGGDSVLAMRMVSNLRSHGHSLSVADVFMYMRLKDCAKRLKVAQAIEPSQKTYETFSLLNVGDVAGFLANQIRPSLADQSWLIKDVYPVTETQVLDINGTLAPLRTSYQYTVLYLGSQIDRAGLVRACGELVNVHGILRTVFVRHRDQYLQVVLQKLELPVAETTATDSLAASVQALCTSDINDLALGDLWTRFFLLTDSDGTMCLVIGLSHAQYDGVALLSMLHDLAMLYDGQALVAREPFSRYIAEVESGDAQSAAEKYWSSKLADLHMSALPKTLKSETELAIFRNRVVSLDHATVTPATILTTAWALVLARHLQTNDVTFGTVTSGRTLRSTANIHDVVGPCYQIMPVRINFSSAQSASHLLEQVQRQIAEGLAYDHLGFRRIRNRCTRWGEEVAFFDSIVHHQDAADTDDQMMFGGRPCTLDAIKPHGDSGSPWKIVSFVEDGKTSVGVVGFDEVVVEGLLDQLVAAVEDVRATEGYLQLS